MLGNVFGGLAEMIGPKCVHCGKQRKHHSAHNLACPEGKRYSLGYSHFSHKTKFEAKMKSTGGAAEKRKDRKVRRAVKSEPCCACGTMGTDWNPVDPAHIRTWKVTQSDDPRNLIPLCRTCHQLQHREGWFYMMDSYSGVERAIYERGWRADLDPFKPGRFILSHPEIP